MAGDFGKGQGGKQSIDSTKRSPKESGTPKTGFQESPKGESAPKGPGPGVGNSRRGIH